MKTVMATGTFDILHPGHGLFLEEAKKLGGENSKLIVIVARDSTVKKRKHFPVVGEEQRLALIKMLKPVDEAYLGHKTDMFQVVEELQPDIIAIGQDQTFDIPQLQKQLEQRGLKAKVKRVNAYLNSELDSSCKIIKRIKDHDY